ncbi:phage terminase small subunit [Streptomyces chartreusis]
MPKPRRPESGRSRYGSRRTPGRSQPTATITLPVETALDPPPIPDEVEWTDAQRDRWRSLWTSPQSFMWDETAAGTVAVLITYETALLSGAASAWQAQEYRYASEALGLTPKAMQTLGWKLEGTQ